MRTLTGRLVNVSKRLNSVATAGTDLPLVALHDKAIEVLLYMNLLAGNPPFAKLRVDAESENDSMKIDRRQMSPLGFMLDFVREHAYPIVEGDESALPKHLKAELRGRHPLHAVIDDWARRKVLTERAAAVLRTWIPAAKDVQSNAICTNTQDVECLRN